MNSGSDGKDGRLFIRWLRNTFIGWLLGFALVIVLSLVWEAIGGAAQFMVGVGMGTGVGYTQGRLAGQLFDASRRWALASIIGMGTPFVLGDILAAFGIQVPYSLALSVALGGLLAGLLQRSILAPHSDRANWWVLASTVGWALPAGLIALGDSVSGLGGGLLSIGAMFFGGAILGVVTGGSLTRILRRPVASAECNAP